MFVQRNRIRKSFLVLAVLLLAAPLSACGKKAPVAPQASASYAPDDALEVTLALPDLKAPAEGSAAAKLLSTVEKRFGLKLTPTEAPKDGAAAVAAAAAGTLPDVFTGGIFDDRMAFKQLIDGGYLTELPQALTDQYANLGTVVRRYRATESVDGKLWFLPRTNMVNEFNNGQSRAIYYRLDWALKSGLLTAGKPADWQSFFALMDYYGHADPDGNNLDDTFALTGSADGLCGLDTVFYMTFGVRDWVLQGGTWVPGLLSDRAKEATKWAVQAYRGRLIDPELSSQDQNTALEKFASGRTGMLVMDASPAGAKQVYDAWTAKQPDVDIRKAVSVLAEPMDPYNVAYNDDTSYEGGILLSAGLDDRRLPRVLSLLDWLYGTEGLTTIQSDGQLTAGWQGLSTLCTSAQDFLPDAADGDYRLRYMDTLREFWWSNNWRKPMFTRTIFDDGVQNFDSGHEMEKALMHLIATSQNVDEDWPAYVDAINQALPVAAVSKTVNDYAKANHITSEE